MLKRKDYEAIEEMKYALAFTGPDGITINPEECNAAPPGTVSGGRKDMLSVMQTILANVRKATSSLTAAEINKMFS